MKWWQRVFASPHALILDIENFRDPLELEQYLNDISKFYPWVSVRQIAEDLHAKRSPKGAAVWIPRARKGIFLQTVPFLKERRIPFSLGIHTSLIGTNRLPEKESNVSIDKTDPLQYWVRWTEIEALGPDSYEPVWAVETPDDLRFAETRLRRPITLGYLEDGKVTQPLPPSISACLSDDAGKIERDTAIFRLPTWRQHETQENQSS